MPPQNLSLAFTRPFRGLGGDGGGDLGMIGAVLEGVVMKGVTEGVAGAARTSPQRSGRRGRAPAALSRPFPAVQPPPPALPCPAPPARGQRSPSPAGHGVGAERGRSRTPRGSGERPRFCGSQGLFTSNAKARFGINLRSLGKDSLPVTLETHTPPPP